MGSLYDGWTGEHDDDFTVIGDDGTAIAWYAESIGLIEEHRAPDGSLHSGSVWIDPARFTSEPHWTVEAGQVGTVEGLTLSPSIACCRCGHHGWIRDGRWVSA